MEPVRWILLSSLLAGALLSACAPSCLQPFARTGIVAAIAPPLAGAEAVDAVGICVPIVHVENEGYYDDTRAEGWEFAIDEADLTPHGEAIAKDGQVQSLSDPTVFAIEGLDPAEYVAMRSTDGRYFILVVNGHEYRDAMDVDAVLCRYATGAAHTVNAHCGEADPVPSG